MLDTDAAEDKHPDQKPAKNPTGPAAATERPPRPIALPVEAENIPAELKALPQWVVWRYELNADGTDWTKVPYVAGTRRKASHAKAETWATFEEALAASEAGDCDGIGFVFNEDDPYCGIDLDDCHDEATGTVAAWARPILADLNTYAELSPSASGVKIILVGKMPGGGRKKAYGGGAVEMYDRLRYFTLTGHKLDGHPGEVRDGQAALDKWHGIVYAEAKPKATPRSVGTGAGALATDAEVMQRIARSKVGAKFALLWQGDCTAYDSRSEADLACCNYIAWACGSPDAGQVDRIFRHSGLFRAKWDERHYGDGRTYGQATVAKALDGRTSYYTSGQQDIIDVFLAGRGDGANNGVSHNGQPEASHDEEANDGQEVAGDEPSAVGLRNDTDNAERFAHRYRDRLRHCWAWKKWLLWDGKRWREDDTGRAERAGRVAIKRDYAEVAREIAALKDDAVRADDQQAKEKLRALLKRAEFLLKSMDKRRVDAMLSFARSELPVPLEALNTYPDLLNCNNGTLDLRTGELRPHRREDYLTTLCRRNYRPGAPRPVFNAFLDSVLPGEELQRFVQQLFGLGLIGTVHEHILPIFYGAGRNGKTTLVEAVLGTLGKDYADAIAPELLLARNNEAHPTEVADLFGRRIVVGAETKAGKWLNTAAVKRLTGAETLKGRRMREDFWSFLPSHTIFLLTNNKPKVDEQNIATWSRLKLVPFTATFYKPNELPPGADPRFLADTTMPGKLLAEAEGILAWMVEGCLDWQRNGLIVPDEVEQATEGYRADCDLVARFLAERTRKAPGSKVRANAVYGWFQRWLGDVGEDGHVSMMAFGERVEQLGVRKRTSNGVWYLGIERVSDHEEV
jgi:putative DNA primase/helicase